MTEDRGSEFIQSCLTDTGFLARNVLGYNSDKNEITGEEHNIGKGGIRNYGPHQEMVTFIDSEGRLKMLQGPRGCYKTTLLKAYATRLPLKNPNIRVLYGMAEMVEAQRKLMSIRNVFTHNETFKEHFGDLKGEPWGRTAFTLNTRTRHDLDNETFSCFGVDKNTVGGHFDVIILDDLVTLLNSRNPEQIEKVIDIFRFCQPLLDPGGVIIDCGTRYHDEDLHGFIGKHLEHRCKKLIIDCGMYPEKDVETGKFMLVGKPRFEHMPEEFLKEKLDGMTDKEGGVHGFLSQYCNNPIGAGRVFFSARDFRSAKWEDWMEEMPFYVFTDVAVSQKEENCYSVVAIGGLDDTNRFYLADLRVGHWLPQEFVTQFYDMINRWEPKVGIRGVLMEKVTLTKVFKSMIEAEGRARRVVLPHFFEVPRSGNDASKVQRIKSMTGRIAMGHFLVLDTVDRYYRDLGKQLVLWDPEGAKDDKGHPYPDGELVKEFTRFPAYGKRDIADALADIESRDNIGTKFCQPMSRMRAEKLKRKRRKFRGRTRGQVAVTMTERINGIDQRVDARAGYGNPDSFWSDLAKRAGR